MRLRKINNNYLGDLYIEKLDCREEEDRIKIYDSNFDYLDYLSLEFYEEVEQTEQEQYDCYIEMLEQFESVEALMDWLVCKCEFIGSKDEMIRYLHEELNWDLPSDDYNPLDNEYVNQIGNVYVLISEY